MFNNSSFNLVGRLAAKPVIFDNSDGSRKVSFTVYVRRTQAGSQADAIAVEAFLPAAQVKKSLANGKDGNAIYSFIDAGDLVNINGHIQASSFEKDGKTVYAQALCVDSINPLETKTVREQRAERHAAEEAAENAA